MAQSKLLHELTDAIRTRHYSIRTEQAYVKWVKNFMLFHQKKHPAEMGEKEISEYLTFLAVKRQVAASTQNQALSAILFLYKQVLYSAIFWKSYCRDPVVSKCSACDPEVHKPP